MSGTVWVVIAAALVAVVGWLAWRAKRTGIGRPEEAAEPVFGAPVERAPDRGPQDAEAAAPALGPGSQQAAAATTSATATVAEPAPDSPAPATSTAAAAVQPSAATMPEAGPAAGRPAAPVAIESPGPAPAAASAEQRASVPGRTAVDRPMRSPAREVAPPQPQAEPDEVLPLEHVNPARWAAADALDCSAECLDAMSVALGRVFRSRPAPAKAGDGYFSVRFEDGAALEIARADAALLESLAQRQRERRLDRAAGESAAGWLDRGAAADVAGAALASWARARYFARLDAELPDIKGAANAIAAKLDEDPQRRLKKLVHDLSRFLREVRENPVAAMRKPVFLERVGDACVEADRLWLAVCERSAAIRARLGALAAAPRFGEMQLERSVQHLRALTEERRIEAHAARLLAALTTLRLGLGATGAPPAGRSLEAICAACTADAEQERALRERLDECQRNAKAPAYTGKGEFESNRTAARTLLAKLDSAPAEGAAGRLEAARAALTAGFLDGAAAEWNLLLRWDRDGRCVEARRASAVPVTHGNGPEERAAVAD